MRSTVLITVAVLSMVVLTQCGVVLAVECCDAGCQSCDVGCQSCCDAATVCCGEPCRGDSCCGLCRRRCVCWHGGYYNAAWGTPVALVVPPNADYQTNWGWGVGNTRVTRIWPQFNRNWPGQIGPSTGAFRATPAWPSDTNQYGVYYIRGPW